MYKIADNPSKIWCDLQREQNKLPFYHPNRVAGQKDSKKQQDSRAVFFNYIEFWVAPPAASFSSSTWQTMSSPIDHFYHCNETWTLKWLAHLRNCKQLVRSPNDPDCTAKHHESLCIPERCSSQVPKNLRSVSWFSCDASFNFSSVVCASLSTIQSLRPLQGDDETAQYAETNKRKHKQHRAQ